MVEHIADIAFELLLDTSLAASGDKNTLPLWRKMGIELPEELTARIGPEWIDCLMLPDIHDDMEDPTKFPKQCISRVEL